MERAYYGGTAEKKVLRVVKHAVGKFSGKGIVTDGRRGLVFHYLPGSLSIEPVNIVGNQVCFIGTGLDEQQIRTLFRGNNMTTPVWVITGLLDSGKTTLINQLIEQELDEQDILVIQFESGETPLTEQERVKELVFSKNQLEQIPFGIADTITRYIDRHSPDLILVEWNGMEHFHRLEEMLLQFTAKAVLSIEKVVYAADGASFKARIPDAGAAAYSQIAGSDCAYVRLRGHRRNRNDMDVLYNCNPDIRVYTSRDRFARALFRFGMKPRHCFLMILTAVMLYMMVFPLLNEVGVPPGRYVSIFFWVFLQAAPFWRLASCFHL